MTEVAPWYQGVEGVDAETIGVLQNKGWDKLDGPKAAAAAVKAYREAERHIGAPPEQIIRMPKDPVADVDAMKAIWQRLGAGKEAKDYDFSSVKKADGTPAFDEKAAEFLRTTMHGLNLPKDAAVRLAGELFKQQSATEAAMLAEFTAKIGDEKKALEKDWGSNLAANTNTAKAAAAALGFTPEHVAAFESVAGYAKVMNMLLSIGQKIGEDKFVRPEGGNGGVMTVQQAAARKAELMADVKWKERYFAKDAAAVREFGALNEIIVGGMTA